MAELLQGSTWTGWVIDESNEPDVISQDDNALIHTAGTVPSLLEEHEDELQHFLWPAQSPNSNIMNLSGQFGARSEEQIPTSNISKATSNVREEWYEIPLETVQNMYESILRRNVTVLKEKCGPAP
jgi:hypothetical protein